MNPQLVNMLLDRVVSDPSYRANPRAQAIVQCIRDNDAQRGKEIASNLCQSYGMTPEQAINRAKGLFHI